MPANTYLAHPAWGFHDSLPDDLALAYRAKLMGARSRQESWQTLGTAYHALTLEGKEAFDKAFAIVPEEFLTDSGRVSTSKAAKAWKESEARVVLSPSDAATCGQICAAVHAHPVAAEILSAGRPEVEWFGTCAATGLPIKACADWLTDTHVWDLKGCQSLDEFADDARRWHYVDQIAWYCEAFGKRAGGLIAVEKSDPFRVGVWEIDGTDLADAQERNRARRARIAAAIESDRWPSAYAAPRILTLTA